MERIRDVTVAEEIAAQAGTDTTPELVLGDVLTPIIFGVQRPPLASSGYFPGTVSAFAAAIALNTSHAGIFISGFGGAIGRVNWILISNFTGGALSYDISRLDAPFTGFPSVRAVPGYINAGSIATGRVFTVTKTDTVGKQGATMANFRLADASHLKVEGPWVVNDGALIVSCTTVQKEIRFAAGYETWQAIRNQAPG